MIGVGRVLVVVLLVACAAATFAHAEEDGSAKNPVRAVIKLNKLPKVRVFVKELAETYPRVTVNYVPGHVPTIYFYDEDDNLTEEIDLSPLTSDECCALLTDRGFTGGLTESEYYAEKKRTLYEDQQKQKEERDERIRKATEKQQEAIKKAEEKANQKTKVTYKSEDKLLGDIDTTNMSEEEIASLKQKKLKELKSQMKKSMKFFNGQKDQKKDEL